MKIYSSIIILLAICFYSCKKTVVLDLNNAPAQTVIQGDVTNESGPYTITINQSVGFYADNVFPPVSGAVVKISDNNGITDSLTETTPGVYSTHTLQGQPGNTYILSVVANNINYTATSTMPMLVPFDSISFRTTSAFGQTRTNALVNFQDPAGIKNQYQFIEYINGKQFTKSIFVFDDRLSDGRYITSTLFTDSTYFNSGDVLKINMNCIDPDVYTYFYQLSRSSGNGTFGSTASPANPTSNINNGALGYFSAHTTEARTVVVP